MSMGTNVAVLRSGGQMAPIVPQSLDDCARLARMAVMSGMLKPLKVGYGDNAQQESPEATLARGTMIIMQGMEIGVPPMQAVQLLAMINGRITAHSEAVPGILLAKGFRIERSWTGTAMTDDWTACCKVTRPDGQFEVGTFSVKDAKQARLWEQAPTKTAYGKTKDNDSAWFRYPKRMLMARALGFASKDIAADALRGIMVREEAEDIEPSVAQPLSVVADLPDIPDEAPAEAEPVDQSAVLRELESKLQAEGADAKAIEREYAAAIMAMDEDGREMAIEMIQAVKG